MKKFTMLLASLFLVVGTAWADAPTDGQLYRLKNVTSSLYMHHGSSMLSASGDGVLKLRNKADAVAQYFYVEAVEGSTEQFYLKNFGGKYVNKDGWNFKISEATTETPFTIALIDGETDVYSLYQAVGDDYYGYVGADAGTDGSSLYINKAISENAQWQFEPVSEDEIPVVCDFAVDKTYRIKSEYSGLYMQLVNYTQTSGEGAFQLKDYSAVADGQVFAFEKAAGDDAGKYYLKTVSGETTYYVNYNSWNFVAGAEPTTPFAVEVIDGSTTVYSLNQQAGETYKGYAGNDKTDTSDGKYTYIYCNVGSLTGNTIWSFEEVVEDPNVITEQSQLSNDSYYKLSGERGFIFAADDVVKGTNAVSQTYNEEDMNQHFAIINKDDQLYLYNVGAERFVVKSGNNTSLTLLPEQPITLEKTSNEDYVWSILLNGTNKINLSYGHNSYGIYTEYNGDDQGNRWLVYKTGTFDPTEALAAFDRVYVTVNYVLGSKKTVTTTDTITVGSTYSFSNPYVYTSVASCTANDTELTATDGVYSFTVSEETVVTVNLEEELPFTLTEDTDTAWHALKIRPSTNKWVAVSTTTPYPTSTTRPATVDGLWAFTGNAIDGIQIYNKGAAQGYTLGASAVMAEGTTTWTLGVHSAGFLLRQGTEGNKYLHDFSQKTLQVWNSESAAGDEGSAFVAIDEAEMIELAEAAKTSALASIALYEEADYYTYADDAIATAKATIEALKMTDILTAMQNMTTIENAMTTLRNTEKSAAPAVGDYILLKNRSYGTFLKDNGTNAVVTSDNDLTTIWRILEGDKENMVKLQNHSTERYLGFITTSEATPTVEVGSGADTVNYVWENPADVYAAFRPAYGGSMQYGHINGGLVGWYSSSEASQWIVSKATTLNITYNLSDVATALDTVATAVGQDYIVESPYAFTKITAVTVDGESITVSEDGTWSFPVTGTAEVVVTLEEEEMPFKTTTIADGAFVEDTEWYIFRQKNTENIWSYYGAGETNVVVRTQDYDIYQDSLLWCVTGNVIDGYKIYNKKAGATMSLNNAAPAVLVADNTATWEISNSTAAFTDTDSHFGFKRPGGQYANLQGGTLKGWSLDAGSTTNAVAVSAVVSAKLDAWTSTWLTLEDGIVGGVNDKSVLEEKMAIYGAAPTQANEDEVNGYINGNICTITSDKYYMIVSADDRFFTNQGVQKAIYSNGSDLRWGTLDKTSKSYYWQYVGDSAFVNAEDGKYMALQTTTYPLSGAEATTDLVMWDKNAEAVDSISYRAYIAVNAGNALTEYTLNLNSQGNFHANSHGNGGGNEGNIIFWGDAGNAPSVWKLYEVNLDLVIAIAELQAKVDELNSKIEFAGSNPGEYSKDATDQLPTYIAAAQNVLDGGSDVLTDYTNALATLESSIALLNLDMIPVTEGRYRIVSAATDFTEEKCITLYAQDGYYRNRCNPGWATADANDPKQYWTLEDAGNGAFYLKGADNNYITTATSMSETKKAATFESIGEGQFNIKLEGDDNPLHCLGWNWSNTTEAALTTWGGGVNSCSAWKLVKVSEEPEFTFDLTVSAVGYATLMLGFDADVPENVKCYTVEVDEEGYADMILVEGDELPANTPVIAKANEGTYTFTSIVASNTATINNELKGTLYPKFIVPDDNTTCYVLAKIDERMGFHKATLNQSSNTAFLNNANKVYLPVEVAESQAAQALSMRFGRGQGGTTDIENMEAVDNGQSAVFYDLTGRRITEMVEKGVYIVNGKKVVIR